MRVHLDEEFFKKKVNNVILDYNIVLNQELLFSAAVIPI